MLQTSLYVALRRETELADLDREWLGRVNAMILRLAVGWTVFALGCLILPVLVSLVQPGDPSATWSGGASRLTAPRPARWRGCRLARQDLAIGRDLAEKPAVRDRVRAYLPVALGVLFGACLLVVFGGVLNFVLAQLQLAIANAQQIQVPCRSRWLPLVLQAVVAT